MSKQPFNKRQKLSDYKSKNYFRSNKKNYLEVGLRGFLATCNFREKDCIRECFNILNEYADELYGRQHLFSETATSVPSDDVAAAEESPDIADELQKEIDAASASGKSKDAPKHRFHVVDTATANCVFIKTTLSDPVELGQSIIRDIECSKKQKARFLLRLIPIETVCRANLDDILKAAGQLCDKYFLKQNCTYSIVFNKRYNNDLKRDDVIHALAELVQSKNVLNKVDLKQPEKSVIVEVIKGLCCITVLEGYLKYKKYNILELANEKPKEEITDVPEAKLEADESKAFTTGNENQVAEEESHITEQETKEGEDA